MKKGFTLIELLIVVAIIAIVGANVAVTYGRQVVDDARRQMTIHEMGQIRDAFRRFWTDNYPQMLGGMTTVYYGDLLPNSDFEFAALDAQTYSRSRPSGGQRLYGVLQFFERYGLWPLFQRAVYRESDGARIQVFSAAEGDRRYEFVGPSSMSGGGWKGPYLGAESIVECVLNAAGGNVVEPVAADSSSGKKGMVSGRTISDADVRLPQPRTRYDDGVGDGIYRVFYFEHCDSEYAGQPIYRRLVLMAAMDPASFDTWDEIRVFAGNRRWSGADGAPLDASSGAISEFDAERGVFFMELLNLDTVWK